MVAILPLSLFPSRQSASVLGGKLSRHYTPRTVESVLMNRKDEPQTLLEWLGFTKNPDFSRAKSLGSFIGNVIILFGLFLLATTLIALYEFLRAGLRLGPYAADVDGSAIRNTGLVLAALFGAPFIVWRAIVASKQVKIADESLFNDKINAAARDLSARKEVTRVVQQDGKEVVLNEWEDDLVSRAAAIDRLEGLAQERTGASPRVDRLLATYVRGNFPRLTLDHTEPPFTRKTPRMDLQKAIDTIGRIHKKAVEVDKSNWRLDLKGCDFDGVSFQGGSFWAADMSDSRFEGSIFREANLEGCLFVGSLLNFSDFFFANLTGAKLDNATINRSGGVFNSFGNTKIRGVSFIGADISGVSHLGRKEEVSETFGTKDTKVSDEVRHRMLDHELHARAHTAQAVKDRQELSEDEKKVVDALENTGFQNWSPYDSADLATGLILSKLYEKLDMKKWPYW